MHVYACMYVCTFVCMYVCMFVCILLYHKGCVPVQWHDFGGGSQTPDPGAFWAVMWCTSTTQGRCGPPALSTASARRCTVVRPLDAVVLPGESSVAPCLVARERRQTHLCMYQCMYVCVCICHVYVYVCICMYVCMCMYVFMYLGMYVCMFVYMCMYVYVYVCVYICMHVCMYVYMYVHVCVVCV